MKGRPKARISYTVIQNPQSKRPPKPELDEKDKRLLDSMLKGKLKDVWVFMVENYENKPTAVYGSDRIEVMKISTIKAFWECYNSIERLARVQPPFKLHLFKEGIMPAWEDEQNLKGGIFSTVFEAKTRYVNFYWEVISLAMLNGIGFGHSDKINGVTISRTKTRYKLSLWVKKMSSDAIEQTKKEMYLILYNRKRIQKYLESKKGGFWNNDTEARYMSQPTFPIEYTDNERALSRTWKN